MSSYLIARRKTKKRKRDVEKKIKQRKEHESYTENRRKAEVVEKNGRDSCEHVLEREFQQSSALL